MTIKKKLMKGTDWFLKFDKKKGGGNVSKEISFTFFDEEIIKFLASKSYLRFLT